MGSQNTILSREPGYAGVDFADDAHLMAIQWLTASSLHGVNAGQVTSRHVSKFFLECIQNAAH
jgi:hypothetical protein